MEENDEPKLRTYLIIPGASPRPNGIRCRLCGLISYHPADIVYRFCGNCKIHHGGLGALLTRSVAGHVPPDWWNHFPEVAHRFFDQAGNFSLERVPNPGDMKPISEVIYAILQSLPQPPRKGKWFPYRRGNWVDGDPGTLRPEGNAKTPEVIGPDPTAI